MIKYEDHFPILASMYLAKKKQLHFGDLLRYLEFKLTLDGNH
jgi:hypothetical protein